MKKGSPRKIGFQEDFQYDCNFFREFASKFMQSYSIKNELDVFNTSFHSYFFTLGGLVKCEVLLIHLNSTNVLILCAEAEFFLYVTSHNVLIFYF